MSCLPERLYSTGNKFSQVGAPPRDQEDVRGGSKPSESKEKEKQKRQERWPEHPTRLTPVQGSDEGQDGQQSEYTQISVSLGELQSQEQFKRFSPETLTSI